MNTLNWLKIVKDLKSISQAGKNYAENHFQRDRFIEIESIAAQILAHKSELEKDHVQYIFQEDTGYPTPKVDSRGVIFKDNKILLVREIADGGWTLPGGWCDNGLTPSENVIREIWEESGFKTKVIRLIALYDRDAQGHSSPYPFNIYKLFFHCEIIGGEATSSDETSDVRFFSREDLPPLSTARTTVKQLNEFFDYYDNTDSFQCKFD